MRFLSSRKGSSRGRITGLLALSSTLFSTTVKAADPCKEVSYKIEAGAKQGQDPVYFPAKLAYACLKALPINQKYAQQTADGLLGFHEVISYQTYFKNPPTPELETPVWDGAVEIQKIQDRVKNGEYQNLYDFAVDVYKVFSNYRDGHTSFMPSVLTVFKYAHPFSIVSVAKGPTSVPKIWTLNEQRGLEKQVTEINGQPVVDYLISLANSTLEDFGFADPDTRFNMLMSQFPTVAPEERETMAYFQYVTLYPGDQFTMRYADGSTEKVIWSARLQHSEIDWLSLLRKGVGPLGKYMWYTKAEWKRKLRKWTEEEAIEYAQSEGWAILDEMNVTYPDISEMKSGSPRPNHHGSGKHKRPHPKISSTTHYKPNGKREIEKRDVEAMKKLLRKMKKRSVGDYDYDEDYGFDEEDGDDGDGGDEYETTTKLPATKTTTTHHTRPTDDTTTEDDDDDDDGNDDYDDDEYDTTTKLPATKTTTTHHTRPTDYTTIEDDDDDDDVVDDDDDDYDDDDDDEYDEYDTTTKLPAPTKTATTPTPGPTDYTTTEDDDDDNDYEEDVTSTKPSSPTMTPATDYPYNTTDTNNDGYPEYFNSTTNGNFKFYIMDEDVAILDVSSFEANTQRDRVEASDLLDRGLDYISAAGVKYLIIDLTNNGGGAAFLPFDFTRMLFPNKYIFESVNMRYTKQNYVFLKKSKLDQWWTTQGKDWQSLEALFSPVDRDGDKFTQMFRYDHLQITEEDGYGVDPKQKQLFPAENIVVLGNGYCGSACFAWYESLHRQGVRSYAMGGRPNGSKYMQTSGGVKGGVVASFDTFTMLKKFYEAFSDERAQKVAKILPGPLRLWSAWSVLNVENQFRHGEEDQLPLEFIYTAACKRFSWTKEMMVDTGYTWRFIREQAWDKDGKPTDCEKPYVTETTYKPTTTTTTTHDKGHYRYGNNDRIPPHAPPKAHPSNDDAKLPPPHARPHHPKPKPIHGDVTPTQPKGKKPVGDVTPTKPKNKGHGRKGRKPSAKPVGGVTKPKSKGHGRKGRKDRKLGGKEHVKEGPMPKSHHRKPSVGRSKGKYNGDIP